MSTSSSCLQQIAQTYHQFKLINYIVIPELQCVLRELVHEPTGAQVMHIENDDPENLFCLSFKTFPHNSNGVAHILEHTVLCGSKKFPVKDPFFAMNRRSLNTYMNALTGSDFTCYPASSQVEKDFYNILEVYLDAVFNPNLKEFSFLQEGHRLEFSDPNDPTSPLEYKGIVYNEMKGALASGNARLAEAINQSLFPNITYGNNSGGDPKDIPSLTYEELKQFHSTFYHPSRCLFFFYGNMHLEKHLDFIAEQTLNHTLKVSPISPIPLQPRFKEPVYKEMTYPIAPTESIDEKSMISFSWLTCNILEQQEVLALSILEIILMDTDASLLKRELLKSGLCKQANSFIDVEINEIPCAIMLKGCYPENADALEKIIRDTLKDICQKGIPNQNIENAIHQLEFYRSEITGDHAPFGLSLFMRSALLKQHGANPEEGLRIHTLFERLRNAIIEDPDYLSSLIKKHFLNNTHFVRIVMKPDPNLSEKELDEENTQLDLIKKSLTNAEAQFIVEQAKALERFQEEQEGNDDDVLPKVTLNDIPLEAKDYELLKERIGNLTVFCHHVFTNDIIYADVIFDLPNLDEEEIPYLHLFTEILSQMGCNGRNYLENLDFIQGNTGGIAAGVNLNMQAADHFDFHPTFFIRGKALSRKAPELFKLLYETLMYAQFDDVKRLKEVIEKHYISLESRLNQSALKYAINLSASGLNRPSKIANDLYGLNYYWKIEHIVKNFEKIFPDLLEKFTLLKRKIISLGNPHLVISCDQPTYKKLKQEQFYDLHHLKELESKDTSKSWKDVSLVVPVPSQGRVIASPVSFIGHVFQTVSYVHSDAPALNVAAYLFDNVVLHARIREQGGAYGGGAVSSAISGNFYFYSYRDPQVIQTINAFYEAIEDIKKGNFDESDLIEAKIGIIQGLDTPISPGSQAEIAYSWLREGRTYAMRQAFRQRLLALTKEEVMDAVERIIVPQMSKGASVVFASRELLQKANHQLFEAGLEVLHILDV